MTASWMGRLTSRGAMWIVLGVSALGPAIAGVSAWRASARLNEESEAFAATTHVRGWARAEGGGRPNVVMVPRLCDAHTSRDFHGVPVRQGPFTLHQGTPPDFGNVWIRIVEDELRGTGLKFQLPGEDPVILEKNTCEDLTFVKPRWGTGSLRFDCRRGTRRFQGAIDFRNCEAGWTPDAIVYWRDHGLW